ncbi:MAG: hypothetical protein KatS3mg123_0283 [Burkholderiales bacterium]|nr:MAG: hypothetical protein KatS3mg123_0283 [Burkholderiales bacterium]
MITPYLVRKNVKPVASLREMDAEILAQRLGYTPKNKGEPLQGRILIAPVRVDGALATLEMIDEQGRKSALAGGAKRAGCWATGPLPERGRVVLAEGVATALSIAEALGEPVAAALSVGNLAAAGEAIRAARPGIELVIAADLDKTGHPHPEAIRAAEALRCPLLSPPADLLPGTDFNDLHAARGLEAVRECFAGVEALTAPMSREEALSLAREALMPEAKPDTPYPVDALGPLADVAVEIAHGMQCDVALAGQSVLAAAALLAQSVANVRTLDGAEKAA